MSCRNLLFRLTLLAVVAWPGPHPVVHSHGDCLQNAGTGSLLAMHVAIFHSHADTSDCPDDAPHCHWVPNSQCCVESRQTLTDSMFTLQDSQFSWPLEHPFCNGPWTILHPLATAQLLSPAAWWGTLTDEAPPCPFSGLAFHRHFCLWIC